METSLIFRLYYDELNGIYTAAFCRIFLPFKTVTFSFPAYSAEELPPNRLWTSIGINMGSALKIHPVHRDVYIHHLECLSANEETDIMQSNINNQEYFPPAAASAVLAIKDGAPIAQQRELHETLRMDNSGKVGYL